MHRSYTADASRWKWSLTLVVAVMMLVAAAVTLVPGTSAQQTPFTPQVMLQPATPIWTQNFDVIVSGLPDPGDGSSYRVDVTIYDNPTCSAPNVLGPAAYGTGPSVTVTIAGVLNPGNYAIQVEAGIEGSDYFPQSTCQPFTIAAPPTPTPVPVVLGTVGAIPIANSNQIRYETQIQGYVDGSLSYLLLTDGTTCELDPVAIIDEVPAIYSASDSTLSASLENDIVGADGTSVSFTTTDSEGRTIQSSCLVIAGGQPPLGEEPGAASPSPQPTAVATAPAIQGRSTVATEPAAGSTSTDATGASATTGIALPNTGTGDTAGPSAWNGFGTIILLAFFGVSVLAICTTARRRQV